jgi:formylglycine-generating enzyme required for sulfatase activity
VFTDSTTGMEFAFVKGGCFQMGSPSNEKERDGDETKHEACVDDFYMGKHEVTNRQYRQFKSRHSSKDYKGHTLDDDNQPTVYVSWNHARDYVKWLNSRYTGSGKFRLPTEAEWEYAARAGTSTSRFWGDNPNSACRCASVRDQSAKREWPEWTVHNCDDGYLTTAPVGSFEPNPWGLYDMLGNVWEWTGDWYGKKYYNTSPRMNPKGPSSGSRRVLRGGSWRDLPRGVRSAYRSRLEPGNRNNNLGFRLLSTGYQVDFRCLRIPEPSTPCPFSCSCMVF